MKNKALTFLITTFCQSFLICCNNGSLEKTASVNQLSSNKDIIDTIPVISTKQITGTWEELGKETLTVDITENSFTYREHHDVDSFRLKYDSIFISYPDLTLSGRSYLIKDTLVISTTDGAIKYIRLKK